MHIKTKVISIIVISSILPGCANQIDDSNTQPDQVVYTDLDAYLDSGKPVVIVLDRIENKDVAQKYGIGIAPNMVILDGDGKVIKTGYTGHDELHFQQ